MKNATPLLVLALTAALCGSAIAAKYDKQGKICCLTKGETYSAPIKGKVCQDCAKAIADALLRIKGVDDAWARWPNPYEKGILKVRAKLRLVAACRRRSAAAQHNDAHNISALMFCTT